jgi:FKBP-type peptidyl-prolyl cis-trans isomerase (trigger factor)
LIGALLNAHPFDVPNALVSEAMKQFVEELKSGNEKKLPKGFDRAKYEEEMRPVAERTVRWALLREQIIEREELQADPSDFEGLAEMEAQRSGIDQEVLLKYFQGAEQVKDRILAEKALQLLEDYAIVQDVDDRDLMRNPANSEG